MHADAKFTSCRFVIRGFIESVPAKGRCEKRMTVHSCGDIIYVKENDKEEAKKEDICKLEVIQGCWTMKLKNVLIVVKDIEKSKNFIRTYLVLNWYLTMTAT